MNRPSRIKNLFAHHKARIAYITAGDGGIEHTFQVAMALINGGVNMLEIGIPFSDPVADGPVIQRASLRAIAAVTTLDNILALVSAIRAIYPDIPLILFTYLNPILKAMQTDFLSRAKDAGVDGLLLVDCPLEESKPFHENCKLHGIDLIYVITPSTPLARIQKIHDQAEGFLYYACQKGTTGLRHGLPLDFTEKMTSIKALINLPIVVGFGISNNAMVKEIDKVADGVVVGSLFIKTLENGASLFALSQLAEDIFAH